MGNINNLSRLNFNAFVKELCTYFHKVTVRDVDGSRVFQYGDLRGRRT